MRFRLTLLALMAACAQTPTTRAGWTGSVNGTGYGWAYVSMRSPYEGKFKNSGAKFSPSALMPDGKPYYSSYGSYANAAGYAGGFMQGSAAGYYGDSADNEEIESRANIVAANCVAEIKMEAFFTPGDFPHEYYDPNTQETKNGIDFDPETKSGSITVNSKGTPGTGLLMIGWEWFGDPSGIPDTFPTEIDGVTYHSIQDFFQKNGGDKKFESLVLGRHEYGSGGKCSLVIPYTLEGGDVNKLFIQWYGVAKSAELVVNCPPYTEQSPLVVECGQEFSYPSITITDSCGSQLTGLTAKYNPDPGDLHLGLNTVNVEIFDDAEQQNVFRTCSFVVNVVDTTPPVIVATGNPTDGILGLNPTPEVIEAALGSATASDDCGELTPAAQTGDVMVNGCQRSQTRTWTVVDASANAAIPVSRTVTWTEDTTPPTVLLGAFTVPCGHTGPVYVPVPVPDDGNEISDNCGGAVTVEPSEPQFYDGTGPGVTWTFRDDAGNERTIVQTVIVSSPTFQGFYEPIGSANNSFSSAVLINRARNSLPLKFDMLCEASYLTTGPAPTIQIQKMKSDTETDGPLMTIHAAYQNGWHANFPCSVLSSAKIGDVFKITVLLPGGATPFVFIKLR